MNRKVCTDCKFHSSMRAISVWHYCNHPDSLDLVSNEPATCDSQRSWGSKCGVHAKNFMPKMTSESIESKEETVRTGLLGRWIEWLTRK
jgi:hypothetical protein